MTIENKEEHIPIANVGNSEPIVQQPTLRDQFAMAALPAIIANSDGVTVFRYREKVEMAYSYADAALDFRSSNEGAMASRYGKKKQ